MKNQKSVLPKKHNLKKFSLGIIKPPRCPLCHKFMERMWHPTRQLFIFKCDTPGSCKIAIRVDDPFINRWDEAFAAAQAKATPAEKLKCLNPRCSKAPDGILRYFATAVGFMRLFCAACGAVFDNREVDRHTDTPDRFYSPDAPGVMQ